MDIYIGSDSEGGLDAIEDGITPTGNGGEANTAGFTGYAMTYQIEPVKWVFNKLRVECYHSEQLTLSTNQN